MFKTFWIYNYIWASWACVVTLHSVTDIQVPPVPIQPKTFRFPNVHSTLSSLIREVFSRRGSTVGPGFIVGFITMRPKVSLYACGVQKNSPRKDAQPKSRWNLAIDLYQKPIKTQTEALKIHFFFLGGGGGPQTPMTRGDNPPLILSPSLSCLRHSMVSSTGPLLNMRRQPCLILVQPRKTPPCLTERLLMGRKNQIKQNQPWLFCPNTLVETPPIPFLP